MICSESQRKDFVSFLLYLAFLFTLQNVVTVFWTRDVCFFYVLKPWSYAGLMLVPVVKCLRQTHPSWHKNVEDSFTTVKELKVAERNSFQGFSVIKTAVLIQTSFAMLGDHMRRLSEQLWFLKHVAHESSKRYNCSFTSMKAGEQQSPDKCRGLFGCHSVQ